MAGIARHDNGGLRKTCRCARSRWNKCSHPWHFNLKLPGGAHVRRDLNTYLKRRRLTRDEAKAAAKELRRQLEDGELIATEIPLSNGRTRVVIAPPVAPIRETLTIAQLLDRYIEGYVVPEKKADVHIRSQRSVIVRTPILDVDDTTGASLRPFGDWPVRSVTTGVLERFRAARRPQSAAATKDPDGRERRRRIGGTVATNRNLALLRAAFNWGILNDLCDVTPFKKGTVTAVKLSKESSRRRRLEGDEEQRLLAACDPIIRNPKTKQPMKEQPPPRLRPLVEAALETGCRLGELLSLQWRQVRLTDARSELVLSASKTKTRRERTVPVSSRLKVILEMRRKDPAGEDLPGDAHVFGNAIGQKTESIKAAWRLACRRAGIQDLHFHDLRREAGSRWLEGGVPLQTVRDWLGHTNISQTSTYLESTLKSAHEAMRRYEERLGRECNENATTDENGDRDASGPANMTDHDQQKRSENTRSVVN
jgi:integrase